MERRKQAYEALREQMQARRRELLQRVADIRSDTEQTYTTRSADFEDAAQEAENDEVLDQLDDQARAEVTRIDGALSRMDAGAYGVCVDCGDEVQLGRLEAVPWTLYCVDCAENH